MFFINPKFSHTYAKNFKFFSVNLAICIDHTIANFEYS